MLGTRIITAAVLITVLLSALFRLPLQVNALIFAAATALAAWEWVRLMRAGRRARWIYPCLVMAGCGFLFWAEGLQPGFWLSAAIFWIGIAPLWLVRGWRIPQGLTGYLLGGFLLLATWSALGNLLRQGNLLGIGPMLLLGCMAVVWIADTAAYFAGRLFGRHKLAPAISPGKTWEGVTGALGAVILAGWIAHAPIQQWIPIPVSGLLGWLILLTAVSIVGDLFESLLKRQAGVKDSSHLLPGHGGVLDRIDSLLAALPVAALILSRSIP